MMSHLNAFYPNSSSGSSPSYALSPNEQPQNNTPPDSYNRSIPAAMGSPRDLDTFAFASRSVPTQPNETLAPNPPAPVLTPSGRHHTRGSHSTGDYFSATGSSVRKTPPTSPRMGLKAIPGGGSDAVASRWNSDPMVPREDMPPWMQTYSGSSPMPSPSIESGSLASTPSFASSFTTPSDSPVRNGSRSYDPSLTNGGLSSLSNPVTYSTFVDQ